MSGALKSYQLGANRDFHLPDFESEGDHPPPAPFPTHMQDNLQGNLIIIEGVASVCVGAKFIYPFSGS